MIEPCDRSGVLHHMTPFMSYNVILASLLLTLNILTSIFLTHFFLHFCGVEGERDRNVPFGITLNI